MAPAHRRARQTAASHAVRLLPLAALAVSLLFPPAAHALTREEAIWRGLVWVEQDTPYSQVAYRTADGRLTDSSNGYRTDCSGYTSMCWGLTYRWGAPLSLVTWTLAPADSSIGYPGCTAITKDQLQPGDALIVDSSTEHHAMVFGEWLDAAHAQLSVIEEANLSSGTVRRVMTYSVLAAEGFVPYRYRGIQEDWLDYSDLVEPIYGTSRYGTAAAASFHTYPRGGPTTVIIASGQVWPDALCASALAGVEGAPLLLVTATGIPAATRVELDRLAPAHVVIVGGEPVVSAGVAATLHGVRGSPDVTRIAGLDRYETSRLVAVAVQRALAANGRRYDGRVIVTTGGDFADALAASPLATADHWPVLLSRPDTLGPNAEAAIGALKASDAVVLGSTAALSAQVEGRLDTLLGPSHVSRIGGADRYATSAAVATWATARNYLSWSGAALANGWAFPDGLSGGVMQGLSGSVLLLTPQQSLEASVSSLLAANGHAVGRAKCLGSSVVIGPDVRYALARILGYSGPRL